MTLTDRRIPTGADFRVYVGDAGEDLSLITDFASIATQITAGKLEDVSKTLAGFDPNPVAETAGADFGQSKWRYMQAVISSLSISVEIYARTANKQKWIAYWQQATGNGDVDQAFRPTWWFEDKPATGVDCWRGFMLPEQIPSGVGTGRLRTVSTTIHLNIPDDTNPYYVLT